MPRLKSGTAAKAIAPLSQPACAPRTLVGGVGLGQRLAPSDHVQQKDLGRCLVDLVRAVHVLDEGVPVHALAQLEPPVALVGGLVALRALKEVLRKA